MFFKVITAFVSISLVLALLDHKYKGENSFVTFMFSMMVLCGIGMIGIILYCVHLILSYYHNLY